MRASSLGNQSGKIPRMEIEVGKINDTIAVVKAFISLFGKYVLGTSGFMVYSNLQTINEDLTLTDKVNAVSAGPITIKGDVTVLVTGTSNWKII